MNKGLTMRMGQMHGQTYIPMLVDWVAKGEVDPSQIFTHHLPLEQTKQGFELFKHKQDNCIKVLLRP
jgi:threonine dehydrogenase-like Zn-dependent dehydrogenase